jgi:hypothetical protein
MLMPFGKHKGQRVETLPRDYLIWLQKNVALREPLRSEIASLLTPHTEPASPTIVQNIYHQLARKYHPDMGGNTEAMQAVNEFKELLTVMEKRGR